MTDLVPEDQIAATLTAPVASRSGMVMRLLLAAIVVVAAVLVGTAVMVGAGQAVVVSQFGAPIRVLTEPGLAWKLPAPVQDTTIVDLRLRTTSTGLNDVGTRDGLRILVQAYVAWQVPADPDAIRQFLRAVHNDPDEAARQLRSFVGSALQVTASSFDFADLVNTNPARLQLAEFERRLQTQVEAQVLKAYGIQLRQTGIEMLSLPDSSLTATVSRMRSERETVAAERTAEGRRAAAEVRSNAERDGRIVVAQAHTEAADIEAQARREAASIRTRAYLTDPQLYTLMRSLDTLGQIVGPSTRLVLRSDAAPFSALVEPPIAQPTPGPRP